MNAQAPQNRVNGWCADAAVAVVLLAVWIGFVGVVTGGRRVVLYDTFRDMAWAENMRAGRIWADPTLPGQPYWYAPGNPLLVAGISIATGWSVVDLYGYNAFWCNALLPIALYLLVRVVWDRPTAIVALAGVFLGSYSWLTHAVAGIPSVQGVVLNLVGLWCWQRCVVTARARVARPCRPWSRGRPDRAAWIWPLVTGFVLSLSTWHHPLCGIVLASAIFLHAVLDGAVPEVGMKRARNSRRGRFVLLWRMFVAATVAACLTGPLIVHMLTLQMQNPALLRFFADELMEPAYYAHAQAPLVVPAALLGVWLVVRRTPHAVWIVTYPLVGLVGQAVGFLAQLPGWYAPSLLSHEFLWHGDLALGICAAVGIIGLARGIADRLKWPRRPKLAGLLWSALLAAAAVGSGVRGFPQTRKYLFDLEPVLADTQDLREWIRANTSLEAIFVCPPDTGYQVVSALTGRKCLAVSPGHTNPAVDVQRRHDDVKTMLDADDGQTFARLAERYGATHLLLVFDSPDVAGAGRTHRATWQCLDLAFVSSNGTALVYRIHPNSTGDAAPTHQQETPEQS